MQFALKIGQNNRLATPPPPLGFGAPNAPLEKSATVRRKQLAEIMLRFLKQLDLQAQYSFRTSRMIAALGFEKTQGTEIFKTQGKH